MGRVIRADRAGPARIEAPVASAIEWAQELLAEAQAKAASIREQARSEGIAAGRAELAAALLEVSRHRDRLLAEVEQQAVEVALLAARRIVTVALERDPQHIVDIVRPLLDRVRRARQITIGVHPRDLQALRDALREAGETPDCIVFEDDPDVTRGGCWIRSDVGTLDARVETRLDALAKAIRDGG